VEEGRTPPAWFLLNRLADHGQELEAADAAFLDRK
jgi:hypothetical protein